MLDVEWKHLAHEILGLVEAGRFLVETEKAGEQDHFGVTNEIIRSARRIVDQLDRLAGRYSGSLPTPALTRLREFTQYFRQTFQTADGWPGIQGTLGALASFRTEFEFLLADAEVDARSLVARAFIHLNRSLVANSDLQRLWREAFDRNELACEKLGAVHLLSFGVWAFKVSGAGERTDLVMGTPLTDIATVRRAADVLVLTEWKVVRNPRDVGQAFDQARAQAHRYAVGILGGIELSSRRYAVLVSESALELPAAQEDRGIVYEPVNVAVHPLTPSRGRRSGRAAAR